MTFYAKFMYSSCPFYHKDIEGHIQMKKTPIALMLLWTLTLLPLSAGGDMHPQAPSVSAHSPYYLFAAGGGALWSLDTRLAKNHSLKSSALGKKGALFELGAGYRFSSKFFGEFAYQHALLPIARIDNVYISLNYRFFETEKATMYVGALAGYSRLKWTQNPHKVLYYKNLTSKHTIFGMQLGASYALTDHLSLTAKYQYIRYQHRLNILTTASTVEHTAAHQILAGIRYQF